MSKVVNIGCPFSLLVTNLTPLEIKSNLEMAYEVYLVHGVIPDSPERRVNIAIRLEDKFAEKLVASAKAEGLSVVEFTSRLLML